MQTGFFAIMDTEPSSSGDFVYMGSVPWLLGHVSSTAHSEASALLFSSLGMG
jgi:hypothetical protein